MATIPIFRHTAPQPPPHSRLANRRVASLGALLLLTCIAHSATAQPQPASPDAEAHGRFTGDVKAVIYVSDVERSAPFYRDTLGFAFEGFAETDGEPYYAEMSAGSRKFGLHEPMGADDQSRVGKIKLYFRVVDVAAHHRRVAARGGNPGPIRETAWMTMFTVADPDGNQIVVAETDPDRQSIDPW